MSSHAFTSWPHADLYGASLQAGPDAVFWHYSAVTRCGLSDVLPAQVLVMDDDLQGFVFATEPHLHEANALLTPIDKRDEQPEACP